MLNIHIFKEMSILERRHDLMEKFSFKWLSSKAQRGIFPDFVSDPNRRFGP